MSTPITPPSLVLRAIAVVTAVAAMTACSFHRQPDEVEPTPVPWSDELRYEPVGADLCERMPWDDIGSAADMTLGEAEVLSRRTGWPIEVRCELDDVEADYLQQGIIGLHVIVPEQPDEAHEARDFLAEAAIGRYDPVVRTAEGWWDDGLALETFRSVRGGSAASVTYIVVHENLYLGAYLIAQDLDREELPRLHDVVRDILDSARELVPCRSLVTPPTAECG